MNGFLNLMKPPGMTSSDAVVFIRRTLSGEKVGHAGTLDPEAAGVLPIMVGKAARLFDLLVEKQKEYVAEIAFGASTDTQDAQGNILETSAAIPDTSAIQAVLPRFVGDITQVPPAYSALKIGGRSAHEMARRGEMPALAARPARIDAIDMVGEAENGRALLRVQCGRGVYIRTLCNDIGAALGCPAHMAFLLRTRTGFFSIGDSVTLEEWQGTANRASLLIPMDAPLSHLPAARVAEHCLAACKSGNPQPSLIAADDAVYAGAAARVYCGGLFVGIGAWRENALRFKAVLCE